MLYIPTIRNVICIKAKADEAAESTWEILSDKAIKVVTDFCNNRCYIRHFLFEKVEKIISECDMLRLNRGDNNEYAGVHEYDN